jgi:nucleoside-diphosphate-sugar epimerase
MSKKILITGGAGYVGSHLVPILLSKGHKVTVIDLFIYGNDVLDEHENLKCIKGDIRDTELLKKTINGNDIVIHLACISNDPSFELNPLLGKSINLDAFDPLVKISKSSGVEKFIYASSSSVYGVKDVIDVDETMSLEPLTDYSKFKAECEDILKSYSSNDFITTTIRPATVCGYSRRQRLDVVVNIFTNLAYHKREISVFGGNQLRPNIHINDMSRAYLKVIESENNLVNDQIFNVGDTNYSVLELANMTKEVIGDDVNLVLSKSNDNRSYHISSKKINDILGFKTENTIKDAIFDVQSAIIHKRLINSLSNPIYFNIKTMQNINLI